MILSYGRSADAGPLVDSLLAEGVSERALTVVHNPDGSPEGRFLTLKASVPVLAMERNLGYVGAMNRGLEERLGAGDCWVMLLTHDVRLRPGAVATMVEAARAADGYGVLGPTLAHRESGAVHSFGGIDAGKWLVAHRTEPLVGVEPGEIAPCDWVDGCCLMLRSEALARVGWLERRFFLYLEDAELCLRMRQGGWGVGVVHGAVGESSPGQSRRPAAFGYLNARNGLLYSWHAGGSRRVAATVAKSIAVSWREAPKPGGRRFRGRDARRAGYRMALGIWLGMLAFLLGRWGPPPALLMRAEDVSGT